MSRATAARGGDASDAEDDDPPPDQWELRLPANAPAYKRKLAQFLRVRARLPGWVLVTLFAVRGRTWALLLAWLAALFLSARYPSIFPLYLLGTLFALIFFNLGHRKAGEPSAYSLFNTGQRELPGTFNAGVIDGQLRRGQLM